MKKLGLMVIFLSGLGLFQLHSQAYLDLILNPQQNTTLEEVQQLAEDYFATRDKGRGSGFKQYKRWEYHMQRNVNADGRILNFSALNFDVVAQLTSNDPPVESSAGNWTALGPTTYTNGASGYNGGLGRVNVIAFHPTDANTLYLGVPAGGLWRSTNAGTSWTPLTDTFASIGISGIAVDHSAPNTLYVLTGDGDGAQTYSIGVMKSTDGGTSWSTTGLSFGITSFVRGYKLLMHPTNSSIMFAVTNAGIYKTTDGWATWTNVLSGDFRDAEFKPGSPATMYACTEVTFYRSIDTGSNWGAIGTGLPTGEDRSAIAVSPANSNYVYYVSGPGGSGGSGTYKGLYRSTDSGVSFSTMSTTPNIMGYDNTGNDSGSQTWFDLAMAVNPSDANNVITGGVNIWRSTNGGSTMNCITNWFEPSAPFQYVHADIHELVYNPVDGKLYCGSDGGISVSSDNGQTWTNIWNGLQIMQFYKIAGVEANQNLLLGGTQDNGSNKYSGTTNIEHIYGADGMDCMIDYNNNNILYFSTQNGGLRRSVDGGSTSTGIQPSGSSGSWVTPYGMHPANPTIIYGGYSDVYRSTNSGSTWTNLGSDGRGAFAVGTNDPARLYAANGSTLQTSANTGGSWTTITGPWPTLTITAIALDPGNANRIWITLGGYTAGQKVYESTNAGVSWTNISGSLPNSPALSIAYENTGGSPMDAMYVGMAVGVYYSSDSTAWTLCGTGLPNVPIYDLEINHTNSKIRAGTFGRGFWETSLFGAPVCDILSTSASANPPSCPGGSDGNLTVTATCTTCSGITYIITPTAPPGPPITQVGNGVFTNLMANSYNVEVQDTGDASCTHTWTSNPVVVPAGTDSIAPAISCPTNVTVECGDDTSPTGTGTATAADNCDPSPVVTFSDSVTPGCGLTVVIQRTWTATDASGNSNSCVQTIIASDTTPPVVTSCPSDFSVDTDPGDCEAIVTFTSPTGTDICGNVTVTQTGGIASGSAFPEGATVNTFDLTDDCGNTSTCTFTVTVVDAEPPVVVCPPDVTVNPGAGNLYTVPDYFGSGQATATDNCTTPIVNTSQNPTAGTQLPDGVYVVTLTAEDDSTNIGNCTFQLTVDTILGNDNSELNSIFLYPNPESDTVILNNPQGLELIDAKVYDMTGRLIKTFNLAGIGIMAELQIAELSTATYMMIIRSENAQLIKQLVKR